MRAVKAAFWADQYYLNVITALTKSRPPRKRETYKSPRRSGSSSKPIERADVVVVVVVVVDVVIIVDTDCAAAVATNQGDAEANTAVSC